MAFTKITNAGFGLTTGTLVGVAASFSSTVSVGGTLTYEDVTNVDSVGLITARNGIEVTDKGVQVGTGATVDSAAANTLTFLTNGSERIRVDSNGDVGIGTNDPVVRVHIGGATPYIRVKNSGSPSDEQTWDFNAGTDGIFRFRNTNDAANSSNNWLEVERDGVSTDSIRLLTGSGSERLRIDSSGRLLLGTNSAVTAVPTAESDAPGLQISKANKPTSIALYRNDTSIASGNTLGGVHWYGNDTTSNTPAVLASMQVQADSDHAAGDNPTRITFSTTADGASSVTERVRIDNSGDMRARRARSNTAGDVALSVQPSDSTIHYGLRIDSTNNSLNLDRASGTATNLLTIDSSGNVGIGSESPDTLLNLSSTGNGYRFKIDDATNDHTVGLYSDSTTPRFVSVNNAESSYKPLTLSGSDLRFWIGSTEKARFDTSGRLLIGTTSTSSVASFNSYLQVQGTDAENASFSVTRHVDSVAPPRICLGKSRGTSVGSSTAVQSGDNLGEIRFAGADGTDINSRAASILCSVDGTPGSNDMPGRLVFSTTADGGASPTERARFNSTGDFLVGTTSHSPGLGNQNSGFQVASAGYIAVSRSGGQPCYFNRRTNTGTIVGLSYNGTQRGSITTDGTVVAFNTSSDHRLKENIVDLDGAITRVKQLQPRRFNFIENPSTTVDGFIAHEAQTVVPEAVNGTHNEVDDDGNAVMQGIDQSKLVPLLTAALQEAIAEIETLKTKVAALEG